MKETNYVMRMMDTGGQFLVYDTCKKTARRWKENGEDMVKNFKYKLPFYWDFCYCRAVENHSSFRHALPSFEDTWMTDRWECLVFAFIFSISDINAFLILRSFVYCGLCQEGMPVLLEFLQKLVWQLINNIYIG